MLNELAQLLRQTQWAVYYVQRIYKQLTGKNGKPYVNVDRKVTLVAQGSQAETESNLEVLAREYAVEIEDLYGERFYIHDRTERTHPAFEGFYVMAPKLATDKCRNSKAFDQQWAETTGQGDRQLSLFEPSP